MATMTHKLLRVDLGERSSREEAIPRDAYARFLSARGLGAKYLYDEVAPGTDPLSPENRLIFGIGILGGTKLQGFSKWSVVTKSPLTGTVMRSFTGGNFGVWMKAAGYDQMVVAGRAEKPCYVYVDPDGVHFLDAAFLRGLDARSVQERLKERHGARTEAACIGPAGENLVRYAVITSGERTASRGGVGTVMGSKNLKAVAINVPPGRRSPHAAARFDALARAQIEMLKTNPRRKTLGTLGTPYITTGLMKKGNLPVRNFREGSIDGIEALSGDQFLALKASPAGCYGCMTRCGGMRDVKTGALAGTRIDGPEYESIFAFGPALGITDRQFIIDANAACDYYGLDTISAGVAIGFAFELFERGQLTPGDADGHELVWGSREAALYLLERIANREGLGALLAEGVKRAAEHFPGSSRFAAHVKGLELPGYEPRSLKGYGLSMATSNIGGSHMYGRPRDELAGQVDPFAEQGKGASIAAIQKDQAVEDSLVACTFGNSGLGLSDYARFLEAGTGIPELATEEALALTGERILALERSFNVRDGFGRKDDTLPGRMFEEPLEKAGPASGQRVESLDRLLDEYYGALGYDEAGVPSREKLRELGLARCARELHPEPDKGR